MAVTGNALDNLPNFPRQKWMEEERTLLSRSGLSCLALDLRDYYDGETEALCSTLAALDMVWATGGNAFVLREAFRRSGLDALLLERLTEDSLTYGGYSAGACVCGPTLRGIELVDDAKAVRHPVWDGLGLVDFSVAPHYGSEDARGEATERAVEYFRAHRMPYRALRDGQALLIRGTSEQLIEA